MSYVVEADESGAIFLSGALTGSQPHERFQVEVRGKDLILQPMTTFPPGWDESSPEQRAQELMDWVRSLPPSDLHLTDEQLRRENIYD